MKKNLKAFSSMINVCQILVGLTVLLLATWIYTFSRPPDQFNFFFKNSENINLRGILQNLSKIIRDCVFKLRDLLHSSFIKKIYWRNLLKFKNVSILSIFIFFISILSVNANYHHFVNSIYNDDDLIFDSIYSRADNDLNISIYDVYRIPSNDNIIFPVSIKSISINLHVLIHKFSTRAPPVKPQ